MPENIIQIADNIQKLIAEIGKCRREIEGKGNTRARAIANYDMRIGVAIVTLKEEGKFPATLIEKIAKKLCSEDRYAMEVAESGYKAAICNLECLQAQLNGFQSIYRHLDSA